MKLPFGKSNSQTAPSRAPVGFPGPTSGSGAQDRPVVIPGPDSGSGRPNYMGVSDDSSVWRPLYPQANFEPPSPSPTASQEFANSVIPVPRLYE